jgi:alkylhydroperoxidase family enzyme
MPTSGARGDMTTFPILNKTLLDEDQTELWNELTLGPRGFYCGGPDSKRVPDLYNAWLQFPEFARAVFRVGDGVRKGGKLPGNLRELMVLTTSQSLGARVEYEFHIPFAKAEGIADEIIQAIGEGRTPTFTDELERLIYEANMQLIKTATLTPELRQAIVDRIGYPGLMQFIATATIYVAVAYTTNVADVKLADDFSADKDDLETFFLGKAPAE